MASIKIELPDELAKLIKLDDSEEEFPEVIRMHYMSDTHSAVYRDKNIRGRNLYDLYIPGHPIRQIFPLGIAIAMPVQQWHKGYFFNSNYFIDGNVYTIEDKAYKCNKTGSPIFGVNCLELVEVLDKAVDKIDISSLNGKFIETINNHLATAKEVKQKPPAPPVLPQYIEFDIVSFSDDKFNVKIEGPCVGLFRECSGGYAPAMSIPVQRHCGAYYYTMESFHMDSRYTTLNGDSYGCAFMDNEKIILSLIKEEG